MSSSEPQDQPLPEDLLRAAGRLGDEPAWRFPDAQAVVGRLAAAGRAILGGEIWVLHRDGPLYDIPRLSKNAPVYALIPFVDPTTKKYSGTPGMYSWSAGLRWNTDESWEEYCRLTAQEAFAHLKRIEGLRVTMVPEVRDELWINLDLATRSEAEKL